MYASLQGSYKNGRVSYFDTTDIVPTSLATIQKDIELQHVNVQPKCKVFKACVAKDKSLVHKGDTFVYKNHANKVQCTVNTKLDFKGFDLRKLFMG